jgi:hypothetical protein
MSLLSLLGELANKTRPQKQEAKGMRKFNPWLK